MSAVLASAVALGLALCGAVCFAFSAVHQHSAVLAHTSAVGGEPAGPCRTISLRSLRQLIRRPRWLLGMALAGAGGALALVALSLAPLAVIQPIGVLAVPFALIIHAVQRSHRGGLSELRGQLVPVLAAVLGTAAFVWFVTGTARSHPPQTMPLVAAAAVLGVVVIMLALLGRFGAYRWHALCWATAGAGLYGLGTSMIKSIFLLWQESPGAAVLGHPPLWLAAAVAAVSFPLGVWAVQHAYLAGSPQVVVAGLTVVDPLVCVALGFGLLGEGGASALELTGMAVSAAVALGAVLRLARSGGLPPAATITAATAATTAATTAAMTAPRSPAPHLLTMGRHS